MKKKIAKAVAIAEQYAMIDGGHHKMWVIDQMLRVLLKDKYQEFVDSMNADKDYPPWNEGIAP